MDGRNWPATSESAPGAASADTTGTSAEQPGSLARGAASVVAEAAPGSMLGGMPTGISSGLSSSLVDLSPELLLRRRALNERDLAQRELAAQAYRQQAALSTLQYPLGVTPASTTSQLLYGSSSALIRRRALLQRQAVAALESRIALREQAHREHIQRAQVRREQQTRQLVAQRQEEIQEEAAAHMQAISQISHPTHAESGRSEKPTSQSDVIEIDDSDADNDEADNNRDEDPTTTGKKDSSTHSGDPDHSTHAKRGRGRPKGSKNKKKKHQEGASDDVAQVESPTKRLKSALDDVNQQPVVVVQNWTREGLMEEISKKRVDQVQGILQMALFHATGHTAATAPKNVSFPPSKIHMSITQLHEFAKAVVQEQSESLNRAIDDTFYKCSHLVKGLGSTATNTGNEQGMIGHQDGRHRATVDASLADTTPHPRAHLDTASVPPLNTSNMAPQDKDALLQQQHQEIHKLRLELRAVANDKKKAFDSFGLERAYLKDQMIRCHSVHSKSLRAYLKASVHSLRSLRQSINDDESDEDDDEALQDSKMDAQPE